jgi:hypothetical protein
MVSSRFSKAVSLVALLGFSGAVWAQGTKTPGLGEILQGLEANLNHYDAGVPSLFCDEYATSSRIEPGERDYNRVTDSVFRLKRTPQADHTTSLVESREIKSFDGKPATAQKMDGPAVLSGIFEGGLAVASVEQTKCMNYSLQRINRKRPSEPYVVRFATVLTAQNRGDCFLQEESKGRVFIDPATMQVRRLEITTPHHVIEDGSAYATGDVGRRELSVDYAPVLLGDGTFWMPSAISMRTTSGSGFDTVVWAFRAVYRNYHRLEVTSRIHEGKD